MKEIIATFGDFQVEKLEDGSFVKIDLTGGSKPRPYRSLEVALKSAEHADKMFPQEL